MQWRPRCWLDGAAGGGFGCGDRRGERGGRKVLGAGLFDHRAGDHEILHRGHKVLVGEADLDFQRVELGIGEHLPPLALDDAVAGLGGFPIVGFLVSGGDGHGHGGNVYGGRNCIPPPAPAPPPPLQIPP